VAKAADGGSGAIAVAVAAATVPAALGSGHPGVKAAIKAPRGTAQRGRAATGAAG